MPEPTTVWMVHLGTGSPNDVKGVLSMRDDAVVFDAEHVSASFPWPTIRRAKRLRGSPVLLVEWREADAARRTAFYFTKPPPLQPADPLTEPLAARGAFAAMRRPSKRRHQRQNIRYLQTVAADNKALIQAWATAISERVGA